MLNDHAIAYFPLSVPVNELLKWVNIWKRHRQKFGGTSFLAHDVCLCYDQAISKTISSAYKLFFQIIMLQRKLKKHVFFTQPHIAAFAGST